MTLIQALEKYGVVKNAPFVHPPACLLHTFVFALLTNSLVCVMSYF
jgi:hypothetical protein